MIGKLYVHKKTSLVYEVVEWYESERFLALHEVLVSEDGIHKVLVESEYSNEKIPLRTYLSYRDLKEHYILITEGNILNRIIAERDEVKRLKDIEFQELKDKTILRIADSLEKIVELLNIFVDKQD